MTLTAMLIAGGQSRRMGKDKATLCFGGEPLWRRQLRTLSELGPGKLLVSARARPEWCPAGLEDIPDAPPSRGPLSGLAAGLGALRTSHLLLLAVDLPEMSTQHLAALWALARTGCGVVPVQGDYFEPLCAIYPAEAAAAAAAALASGELSLQLLIRELSVAGLLFHRPVAAEEKPLYRNFNVPGLFNSSSAPPGSAPCR